MSVIFDAVQKTEEGLKRQRAADVYPRATVWRILSEALLLVGLSLLWVFPPPVSAYFLSMRLASPTPVKLPSSVSAVPAEKLVLNGIFFSGQVKVAMINNHMLSEGDAVGGMRIIHIGKETVDLSNGQQQLKLRSVI